MEIPVILLLIKFKLYYKNPKVDILTANLITSYLYLIFCSYMYKEYSHDFTFTLPIQ